MPVSKFLTRKGRITYYKPYRTSVRLIVYQKHRTLTMPLAGVLMELEKRYLTGRLHLLHVILQLLGPRRVAELAEGFSLDLADALAGNAKLATHFFQGAGATVLQAEAQLEHLALALGERAEHRADLLLEEVVRGCVRGRDCLGVLDEVAQVAVLFLADGRFQRDRLLADLEDLAHLVGGHPDRLAQLVGR